MTKQEVDEQHELAVELTDMMLSSGFSLGLADLLDDLASCGLKLKRLIPSDFDEQGVSSVSHAYFRILGAKDYA